MSENKRRKNKEKGAREQGKMLRILHLENHPSKYFFLQLNKNSDFVNRKSTTQKNIKYNFWVEMETRHWGVAQIHMKISAPACQLLWMEQAWGKLQGYKPLCGLLGALAQDALHRELESWKNYSSLAPQITSEERYSFWWRQRVESTASTDRISIYWRQ